MEQKSTEEVVLLGAWPSAYCTRVALAIKLKSTPYKYVEEDLENKSELLLQYNPIHKKVPVLVHNSKSVAESLVILEYIDENWNYSPKLLPEDPYQRAKVRFWVNYYDQKIMAASYPIIQSKGEERKKAIEDMKGMIRVFEEGTKKDFPHQIPFFNGDTLGLLDIIVGSHACNFKAFHKAFDIEVIGPEPQKHPEIFKWVNALKEHPPVKQILPPHDKFVAKMKAKFLASTKV